MWNTWRAKQVRECSANCMVSGGRGGGEAQKGARMWRAGAKKAADAARVSKREHGGEVRTMKGWWERPEGGARWRDNGRERRRRGAHTAAKRRTADHF